ncbi:hypothetical protein CVS40_11988 [Lucilia cuprina]|nr:hypothetical protein CVS40_11988 [Lucilia cuprina]
MVSMKLFLMIFVIVLSTKQLNGLRSFDILWIKTSCSMVSKAHLGFFNCTINNWRRNRGNYLTVHVQFSQTIERILLDFRVSMPSGSNKDMELVKFRSDGCSMSKRKSANPVVTALTKQLLQTGNFSGDCPLEANTTYTMENLSLNPDYFPGYTPEMNFSIKFNMYTDKIHLLAANALASVIKKKNNYCLRSFNIRWRRASCSIISKSYFGFFNCTIHEYPRNRGNYVSAHVQFNQDIERVLLDFRVSMPRRRNNDMDLIKFRSDGCSMSKYQSANPIITALFKQLYQSANFPSSCPLKANTTYNVENLSLNPDYFPGYTPEMNFSIKFNMFTDNVHLLASQLTASRSFDIRWTKANCTIMDSTWMNLFMCPIKELPKNRGNYLQVHFMPKQTIKAIIMDFVVSTPTQNKNKNVDFLKFRTDACKLSSFQSKNPMVAAIFKNLIKGDNFPKNCPLAANFTYSMAHFALNPDYFPGYTPEMNFTTKINFLILTAVKLIEAARNFDIIFNKSNCSVINSEYVIGYHCPIVQLPRNLGNYISGYVMYRKNITKLLIDFRVHMIHTDKADVEVMKIKVDGCKLSTFKSSNPVVSAILKKLRYGGNFPKSCPFLANVNYTVAHFALNPDYFPPYTPEMNFSTKVNMYMGKIHLISSEIHASVIKKGKF